MHLRVLYKLGTCCLLRKDSVQSVHKRQAIISCPDWFILVFNLQKTEQDKKKKKKKTGKDNRVRRRLQTNDQRENGAVRL